MSLDLSALDEKPNVLIDGYLIGKPHRAPLALFYEDLNQPRKEFPEEKMKRFASELKRRGVMSAIIVAPADADGRMRIIHGARRFRASHIAKLPDIPYVIAEDMQIFDDYSQVAENEQRESLMPMELANFIIKRIQAGDKKKDIAQNIGIDASEVTYLISLFKSPDFIKELYFQGKCRTPKYLYELAKLAEKFPAKVKLFCDESDDFSRNAIFKFSQLITKKVMTNEVKKLDFDQQNNSSSVLASTGSFSSEFDRAGQIQTRNTDVEKNEPVEQSWHLPGKIKKPLLLGKYGGQNVVVQLYIQPTIPGSVHITYVNGTGGIEVGFDQLTNLSLMESTNKD